MKLFPVSLLTVSITALTPLAAADVIVPVSQDRQVSGSAYASDSSGEGFDSSAEQATDFGPFVEGASGSVYLADALGSGGGTQNSVIGGTVITAQGSSFANGEGYSFDAYGDGSGQSSFQVVFDVLVPCNYTLTGYIEAYDNGNCGMNLKQAPSAIVFIEYAGNSYVPINNSGTLAPGRYTLNANTSGSASGGGGYYDYASGAYDITLTLTGLAPSPRVYGVTPAFGSLRGGNVVTLNGGCFTPATTVTFGGLSATSVTYLDDHTLEVVVPRIPLSAVRFTEPSGSPDPVEGVLAVDVRVREGSAQHVLPMGYAYATEVLYGRHRTRP